MHLQPVYEEFLKRGGSDCHLYDFINWASSKASEYKKSNKLICIIDYEDYVRWLNKGN